MFWLPEEGLHYQTGDKVLLKFLVLVHAGDVQEKILESIHREWRGD
jgi:hypothetical protein